jgi:hypothetical protein
MPLLTVEAEKLSNDMLRQGILENVITSDEVFALLPFLPINGKAYVYNRENSLGSASFTDTDDTITESAATFTKITTTLKRCIGDVDVDDFLEGTMSDANDQAAVQISKKAKVVGRTYADRLINGDATVNAKEFTGIRGLCASSQKFTAAVAGEALSYAHLDRLMDLVKVGNQRVFVMNSRTLRAYFALCRALGGTDPQHVAIPGITSQVPTYRGIPILKNDYVPVDQSSTGQSLAATSAWTAGAVITLGMWRKPTVANGYVYVCTTAGTTHSAEPTWGTTPGGTTAEGSGTCVWTCYAASMTQIILAGLDENEGVAGLMAQNQAGIEVKLVGPVQNKDATRYRVRWYCGLALHSELALSLANGINN